MRDGRRSHAQCARVHATWRRAAAVATLETVEEGYVRVARGEVGADDQDRSNCPDADEVVEHAAGRGAPLLFRRSQRERVVRVRVLELAVGAEGAQARRLALRNGL